MKKIIITLVLLLCAIGVCDDIDFSKPAGFVNDFAGILSDGQNQELTELAEEIKQDTTAEIAIVTVKTIRPYSIEEYSVRLFEKWGIGRKGKDNGVLLLIAMEERKIKIEVGYGLEGVLPDGLCGEIIRNYIVPEFKKGDYGKGVIDGAREIASVISGKGYYNKAEKDKSSEMVRDIESLIKKKMKLYFFIAFFILFFVSSLFPSRRRRHWYSGGGTWSSGSSFGSFGGSSFGGFGGGRSGGGGASGGW
jgi:uncharacterized protein